MRERQAGEGHFVPDKKFNSDRDFTQSKKRARVIGVTGGVGAGKSRILAILEKEYKAQIILADQVAARLEEPGGPVLEKLTKRFGAEILGEDGQLDRKAFAELIFGDGRILSEVNAVIHPLVWQEIECMISESHHSLVVVESALFSRESRGICDDLWYIDATEENRILRLMESRGYSREKCRAVMDKQPDREYFLALADVVIDNNGTLEETRRQISRLLIGEAGFFLFGHKEGNQDGKVRKSP